MTALTLQNDYMDEFRRRHGRRMDYEERKRKRTAREAHRASSDTQKIFGHKAKLLHAKRHAEKVQMRKTLKAYDERDIKQKDDGVVPEGALPTYLLDREGQRVCLSSLRARSSSYLGRQSTFVRSERSTKRPSRKVFRSTAESPRYSRRGDVQSHQNWEIQVEIMEADGQQADIRGRGVHSETRETRAIHSTYGIEDEQGSCDTSYVDIDFAWKSNLTL